jgi:signal transduction histidine kinase
MKFWLFILSIILISACSRPDRQTVDKLNALSYASHYRDVDTTEYYAKQAYDLSANYDKGRAEALNNLAFTDIVKMQYDEAGKRLNEIPQITDNQIELLVCYVQQMRLCQRRSKNREFYEYRENAIEALKRINEERDQLSETELQRLRYAESEMAIVTSTYYYYVGLERQSIDALQNIDVNDLRLDTAQWLNYLYYVGSGGIITNGTQQEINQEEFDHLLRCFIHARQNNYPFFAANALEALSELLMDEEYRRQLLADNLPALKFINPEGVNDDMLAGWLAEDALYLFLRYGDIYQIAGAYRTLASCYRQIDDYESALYNLEEALSDSVIYQAPDLVASIREQLSLVYSAMDEKQLSDMNRNAYIDLMSETRQDRQLEARAAQYERSATQLNYMLVAVVFAIILLVFLLWLFNRLNKWKKGNYNQLEDEIEQRQDDVSASKLRLEDNERRHLEQRAKISLVNGITPFIDRIIHEINRLDTLDESSKQESLGYIRELTDQINDYNDILTQWIQLRQGELNLKIESFPLQPLFDLMSHSRKAFAMKGVTLNLQPTDAQVKADRVLTLFMLNTLADNARKFTPKGGSVTVFTKQTADYVEVSVADTGDGISEEQLAHIFDPKPIGNHGFGLLNCKGIIEKYRKISRIFSVCQITAESTLGLGSCFSFRLPKGVVRVLIGLLSVYATLLPSKAFAADDDYLGKASIYADSAYFSNINGTYEQTLLFADSCRYYLNCYYKQLCPQGNDLMLRHGDLSLMIPEIKWYQDSLHINYNIILDIRNESAVAALALHEWQLYHYNNRIYTLLYKEMSADNTLADYCRMMQQSQTNKRIAVILLILVLCTILPAYYLLYYRHRLYYRFLMERQQISNLEMMADELRRQELETANLHVSNAVLDNCLSTLKHETMYYPSRIRQLVDQGEEESLSEIVGYYRELYGMLSLQAMDQVERTNLHIRRLSNGILGDENLINYLFSILRKQGGGKELSVVPSVHDSKYVEITMPMPNLHLSTEEAQALFTPASVQNIPYLLCRQIVRDHGEATNRRMCGIWAEVCDGQLLVHIILPAAPIVSNHQKE